MAKEDSNNKNECEALNCFAHATEKIRIRANGGWLVVFLCRDCFARLSKLQNSGDSK